MASNPPFPMEDNTDEDFFDKLVNDDDDMDFKVASSRESGGLDVLTDGSESDDAKAFTNLNVNELDDQDDVNVKNVTGSDRSIDDDLNPKVETPIKKLGNGDGYGPPLVSPDSTEFGKLIDKLGSENGGAEVSHIADSGNTCKGVSDAPIVSNISSGSGAPGVKEVAWSAFNADSVQNDSNGFGSDSDFFSEFGGNNPGVKFSNIMGTTSENVPQDAYVNHVQGSSDVDNSDKNGLHNKEYNDGLAADQSSNMQDLSSSEYWENQYPGWKYDYSTGQWYQIDGYDASKTAQASADSDVSSTWAGASGQVEFSYLQQTAHSVSGAVAEEGTTESVSNWNQTSLLNDATETTNWNQASQMSGGSSVASSDWNHPSNDNNCYPANMVFDPQYPGWYYDTIAQEWRTLESYEASAQLTAQTQGQVNKDEFVSTDTFSQNNDLKANSLYGQDNNYVLQGFSNHGQEQNWRPLESYEASAQPTAETQSQMDKYEFISTDTFSQNNGLKANSLHIQGNNYVPQGFSAGQDQNWMGSVSNYNQQNPRMWLPETASSSETALPYTENQVVENNYRQNISAGLHGGQQSNAHHGVKGPYYENLSQHHNDFSMPSQFVGGNLSQHHNDAKINDNDKKYFSNDYCSNQNAVAFSQQRIQNTQMAYNPASGRSSAGRPAHALVAFGFGGKLIVMKHNNSSENLIFGTQNPAGGLVSVLNLSEVVTGNIDTSNSGMVVSNYFSALCRHSLPGPLTGGSIGTKELNKWIEERLANIESTGVDYRKAEVLRLLLSLLKIACQYYGKLRSPYGSDAAMKESDAPESAVAKLFASSKRNGLQFSQYGDVSKCLQQLPSEGQLQATASEVQNLLVSGRKKEALQCAQEGQLWGPALALAAQLGDQFYVETVKQMALCQLVAGSPLRTLCLLIAGQPADVFSADVTAVNNMAGAVNMPQKPVQSGANYMLDDWEENLAVITANRTKDDELVLIHLGDCLLKEKSDIIAAHICYLVAEASFELYSDSARLCLIGADHWKSPRTYASPEAIQRTEIYEYSKTLGNSQFVLFPFQPYKYVYAHMLAEVGRTSEALKYCQAVLKSLKTGRTLELENLRNLVSSLEERIKGHQQGGFSVNLAPKEFIGKLLNLFDSTAHRVVGGLPPPIPTAGGAVHGRENHYQSTGPRVSSSQSTMSMSSLVPQSMEPINEWAADNKMTMYTRSVSEPDIGRSPMQADSAKGASSSGTQDKAAVSNGTSRTGRFSFGSQLFQKTVGLVLKPRQGRQAKLGETNKFYYDEKLKRWVEEGVEPPAPEAALPPPPTTAAFFQNGSPENISLHSEASHNNGHLEFKSPSTMDDSSGMPPLPPTANQYSARGRMGVRSRYVDTFNKSGGNTVNSFQSLSVPSAKPAVSGGVNPKFFVPAPVSTVEQPVVDTHVEDKQNASTTYENPSSAPPNDWLHSPVTPSSSAMQRFGSMSNIQNGTSFAAHTRRTASWSGGLNDSTCATNTGQWKPLGDVGRQPSSAAGDSSINGGGFGDLHEVEL